MKVTTDVARISATARRAAQKMDWATVSACANEIFKLDNRDPEGHFLFGLAEKAAGRPAKASDAFEIAHKLNPERYDAAIELASQCAALLRHTAAERLLDEYENRLSNSPRYLQMAANTYSRIGLSERAWPLYRKANELQPGIDLFEANMAACAVFLGKIEEARGLYKGLLKRHPAHQRNHYELSRLSKAADWSHIEQMQDVLRTTNMPADKNIFMYYAIGKELEDLEQWDEAFRYYKMAGDAVARVARYDVTNDLELIDKVIEVCDADWLARGTSSAVPDKTPIFIVGLPRTGTTLTERIISSHSQVQSVGETLFMQMILRRESGIESAERMDLSMIEAVAEKDMEVIANAYLDALNYRLGDQPMFIDKYPENFLYVGFIAKAFPHARIVHVKRNPMDTCFAMYKQSFFRYAYTLEDLGRYYVAYDRLLKHWQALLKDRLIEVEYESLVADQETQTRGLLDRLGLEFEQTCIEFDQNPAASATASSVQIREKVHRRSVNRWFHFEQHLQPLLEHLRRAEIAGT